MKKCPLCSLEVKEQNLYKNFQFTLGDFINGVFEGENFLYFHTECLLTSEQNKKPLLTPL